MLQPSPRAYVPFVSVEAMMALVHRIGIAEALRGLAQYIEEDFRRFLWGTQCPRRC